jgi:hypothetical protein
MIIAVHGRNSKLKNFIYLFTAENNILLFEKFISLALGLCRLERQSYTHRSSICASAITVTSEYVNFVPHNRYK